MGVEITHNGEKSTLENDCSIATTIGDYIGFEQKSGHAKILFKIADLLSFIVEHKKQKPVTVECHNCGWKTTIIGEKPTVYMCDGCIDAFINYMDSNGGIFEVLKKHGRGGEKCMK